MPRKIVISTYERNGEEKFGESCGHKGVNEAYKLNKKNTTK